MEKQGIIKINRNLPPNISISDLSKFILILPEKLKSVKAEISAIKKLKLSKDVYSQKMEEARILSGVTLDAFVKMGEFIKEIPKDNPNKERIAGRGHSLAEMGITQKTSDQCQQIADHKDIVERVKAEAQDNDDLPTRTEVLRQIKEKAKEVRISSEKKDRTKIVSGIEIRKGDFKKVLADVYDIDAIITDPPYPFEFIDCFSELSLFAKEHLKKDGFIAVYSGQYHLPEVIKRLSEHLTYVWTFCLSHSDKKQIVNGVNIMCGWKPVLIFSNGRKKMRYPAFDVLLSGQREKSSHEWQQSESGMYPLIDIFTKPGELVVDPFAGSGTFGKVATENGRRFIGAEIKG